MDSSSTYVPTLHKTMCTVYRDDSKVATNCLKTVPFSQLPGTVKKNALVMAARAMHKTSL